MKKIPPSPVSFLPISPLLAFTSCQQHAEIKLPQENGLNDKIFHLMEKKGRQGREANSDDFLLSQKLPS